MQSLFDRITTGVDVRPLMAALDANPKLWDHITARQDHPTSPHKDTKTIFLRWCKEVSVATVFTDLESVDYPALDVLGDARPMIAMVAEKVGATKVGRVILTSLQPGGFIPPHADEGAYADHFERFHVVLKSEPGNVFVVEHDPKHYESANMEAGELWCFNHKKVHHVFNGSRSSRIHLIVDAVAPSYRRERGH